MTIQQDTRSFTTTVTVPQSPAEVYAAAADPRAWWSTTIEGDAGRVGALVRYTAGDLHRCTLEVVEAVPARSLAWRVVDNEFGFGPDSEEWVGTAIRFDLREVEGGTELTFTHEGLVPAMECYDVCRPAWSHYVDVSLPRLLGTGHGLPNDGEVSRPGAEEDLRPAGYTTTVTLAAAPEQVLAAVLAPRGWWSSMIAERTSEPGDVFTFDVPGVHWSRVRVSEVVPARRVVWDVLDARIEYVADTAEWAGTRIVFDLAPIDIAGGTGTSLTLTHEGLVDEMECYDQCSRAWQDLMVDSLRGLVEQGQGHPYH